MDAKPSRAKRAPRRIVQRWNAKNDNPPLYKPPPPDFTVLVRGAPPWAVGEPVDIDTDPCLVQFAVDLELLASCDA